MIIVMDITTRLVIAIKWIGLVIGTLAYIAAYFVGLGETYWNFLLMPFSFLIWFLPAWIIGWVVKGYKSIIPYPYPMKKDGIDYYEDSKAGLLIFLVWLPGFLIVFQFLLEFFDRLFD